MSAAGGIPLAPTRPVARVLVDINLPHLDRLFDYLVPAALDEIVGTGSRVRVRFAGRLLDGFCIERLEYSDHVGRLAPLHGAASPEAVLTAEVLQLCRAVADRYAGTLSDVVRFAVPTRHARAEASVPTVVAVPSPCDPPADPLADYVGARALVDRISGGQSPRAVWNLAPDADGVRELAVLAQATWAAGGSGIFVVPDARDIEVLAAAVRTRLPDGAVTTLAADLGPQRRYRSFLEVLRSPRRIVIGARGAAFAPVRDLRLVVCWDDGDDVLASPQAPYWHAREVLALRAHAAGAACVLAGYARTAEAAQWVRSGWARSVTPAAAAKRRVRVNGAQEDSARRRDANAGTARVPHAAWEAIRTGIATGPVLVHVARRGYLRGVVCDACRAVQRCAVCTGPLSLSRSGAAQCDWCGALDGAPRCGECGAMRMRAAAIGSERTEQELGRAFPGVVVRRSDADKPITEVSDAPAIVIATPGAEPIASGGYVAGVILDARGELERPGLRSAQEALRRWMHAAALVRPRGEVVITADLALAPVQALVRWDAAWFAERELLERAQSGLPPVSRAAAVTGDPAAIDALIAGVHLPTTARLLGPVPVPRGAGQRLLITVPRRDGSLLAQALRAGVVASSARGAASVEVRMDPDL